MGGGSSGTPLLGEGILSGTSSVTVVVSVKLSVVCCCCLDVRLPAGQARKGHRLTARLAFDVLVRIFTIHRES